MMRRTPLIAVLALAMGAALPAQQTPDFTGVWALSTAASDTGEAANELRVTLDASGRLPVMVVEHRSSSGIRVERHQIGIDGGTVRGNLAPATDPARTLRSVKWRDETLVIESGAYWSPSGEPGPFAEHQEVWSLESPERLVIVVTDRRSGRETGRRSLVYTRKMP